MSVSLRGVRFSYPRGFALDALDFTLGDRERVALVGPSGSGKTTVLNLISGLLQPDAGSVRVAETELSALSDAQRRGWRAQNIGFIFQDFALLDYLTARENILYPYRIAAELRLDAAARARADALAQACCLGDKLGQRPGALSQGEQQRVAICRALVTEPKLLLADEATGNLDPANKTLILDLLFERAAAAGAALLAVTHDHELLPRFDRVVDFAAFRADAAS
ncbi:MAG: ATP-binding cassette domain-containing protein [Pseudomonadota bacterium]